MKSFLLCFLILSLNICFAQQTIFHKIYPGIPNEAMAIYFQNVQTIDNGYLMGNASVLLRLDSLGSMVWRKEMWWNANLVIGNFSITESYNLGYLVTGWPLIMSLDNNAETIWMKELVYNDIILNYDSEKDSNLNYFLGGATDNTTTYPVLSKVDSSGTVYWSKIYASSNNIEGIKSMALTPEMGIIAIGASKSMINPMGYFESVIFKVDSLGIPIWSKRYTALGSTSIAQDIKATSDGDYIVAGINNLHKFIMKIDSAGDVLWSYRYSAGLHGNCPSLIITDDGGLAFVGYVYDSNGTTCLLVKTNAYGNIEWTRALGGYGEVWPSHIIQTSDRGFAIAGRQAAPQQSFSLFLIKTDSLGHTGGCLDTNMNVTVTAINDTVIDFILTDSLISTYTVPYTATFPLIGSEIDVCNFTGYGTGENLLNFSISPNPNNGNFKIAYSLPQNKSGKIQLIDMQGKTVFQMQLPFKSIMQQISIPETVTQGLYTCAIYSGDNVFYKKIAIVYP
jgi:hypothetical protein